MTTFILVPGAFHNSWCFKNLAHYLTIAGHEVSAPDLPGMGGTLPEDRVTLQLWASLVADIVSACNEPPVVLGHSRGGIVVSQVAELVPSLIRETVYLAAALLPNGVVPISGVLDRLPGGASRDQIPGFLEPPPFDIASQTAFSGCDAATAKLAYAQLLSEPTGPLRYAMRLSDERFGIVPRNYIETLQDRAVPLTEQRAMQALLPCQRVFTIASDHSPFLSYCEGLAEILCTIADDRLQ